jgi:MoaA/NifB/PqqE/SkfB family radical SAM enzyme
MLAARPIAVRLLNDLKNLLQAQLAVRYKKLYLPSIFAHYTVNSACNLRCSYCYVGQPEIFPQGFSQPGLPIDRAKRVLRNVRRECLSLRIQGGEPLLYGQLKELVRYGKRDLRFWHVSIITNGLAWARHPEKFESMLEHLDLVTVSLDRTRLTEYPKEMAELTAFLPSLAEHCRTRKVALNLNYTATWDELAQPERVREIVDRYGAFFCSTYVMPVRQAGKTPLPLLKNSLELNRAYALTKETLPRYPEVENVGWYREHCDPKLKIKIDAAGGLVYPCENHSYSAGSLEHHTIRQLWTAQPTRYPNETCLGCGKQRFRSPAFRRPLQLVVAARRLGAGAGVV